MSTLNAKTIASTYDQLVKRADTYVQAGTNIELMNDSAVIQPTGLYLESGATTDFVGIGVADPDTALEIFDTTTQLKLSYDATNYASFSVAADGLLNIVTVDPDGAEADICFNPDGNVGIGTTDPATALEIEGTGVLSCQINSTSMADTNGAHFSVYGEGNSVTMISRFGVSYYSAGTNAPCGFMRLDASDQVANFLWLDNTNDLRISTTASHIGTTNGAVIGDQTSDERLKDISSDAFPYGLTQINAITPIKYQFKDDASNRDRLGFGAQTTQSIIPESVHNTGKCIDGYDVDNEIDKCTAKTSDTDYELGMEYIQIIPVLVKAVQELSASNDALKARIEALEA